jgi:hypothetical protein
MDAVLQEKLDGVETTLNALIESIASYNPSVAAVTDLLAADDQLNQGVEQCTCILQAVELQLGSNLNAVVIHQSNNARIHHLRDTLDALNQSIVTNLTLLADIRKDVLATPATVFPESHRNVPYDELLEYANRISRYTVPPTFRLPAPASQATSIAPPQQPDLPVGNGLSAGQGMQASATGSPSNHHVHGEGIGVASLDVSEIQWLDPLTQIPFVPWPSEEVIRQGALAQVQLMLEKGPDASNVGSREDESTKPDTSHDSIMADSHHGTNAGINSHASRPLTNGVAKPKDEKPAVFGGLDLYDPDAEA